VKFTSSLKIFRAMILVTETVRLCFTLIHNNFSQDS